MQEFQRQELLDLRRIVSIASEIPMHNSFEAAPFEVWSRCQEDQCPKWNPLFVSTLPCADLGLLRTCSNTPTL